MNCPIHYIKAQYTAFVNNTGLKRSNAYISLFGKFEEKRPERFDHTLVWRDLERIQNIKAQVKELETQEDGLKARVLYALKDAETLMYQGVKVATCKTQTRSSFDSKAFEKDHPDLYAQYKKTSSTRVLRII